MDFDIDLGVLLVASRKELPYSGPLFENADAETQTLWVRKKTAEHTYCLYCTIPAPNFSQDYESGFQFKLSRGPP